MKVDTNFEPGDSCYGAILGINLLAPDIPREVNEGLVDGLVLLSGMGVGSRRLRLEFPLPGTVTKTTPWYAPAGILREDETRKPPL
jgi:hypothetical protein